MARSSTEARALLRQLFDAAVRASTPAHCVPAHLPAPPQDGRTVVLGAGKASAAMAQAVERHWEGPLSGMVVTRYGHATDCRQIEIVEAAHPVPDAAGRAAAQRILELARGLGPDDLALCLISGGGSALMALPARGLELEDKQAINAALLASGATIFEINVVRKHLSAIKGGRLAAACHPARCVALLISDVPGDDPAVIASGPTVADSTTFADAVEILEKYRIHEPARVLEHLQRAEEETLPPGDPRLDRSDVRIVATPRQALEAAAQAARKIGVNPVILSDAVEGEARDVARVHAAVARQIVTHGQPVEPPCVLLSGGETTVTLRGKGRGGRNAEFLLALAIALDGEPGIHALAADTDGIDGVEENAGAILTPDTLGRADAAGLRPATFLEDNDAYGFFSTLGDLVVTGPTLTNVNDFRALLIAPE